MSQSTIYKDINEQIIQLIGYQNIKPQLLENDLNHSLNFANQVLANEFHRLFNIPKNLISLKLSDNQDNYELNLTISIQRINEQDDTIKPEMIKFEKSIELSKNHLDVNKITNIFIGENSITTDLLIELTSCNFSYVSDYLNHYKNGLSYFNEYQIDNSNISNLSLNDYCEHINEDMTISTFSNLLLNKAFYDIVKSETTYQYKNDNQDDNMVLNKIKHAMDYLDYLFNLNQFRNTNELLHNKKGLNEGVDFGFQNGALNYVTGEYNGNETEYLFNIDDFIDFVKEKVGVRIENTNQNKHKMKI